jgi:hypothetical protein
MVCANGFVKVGDDCTPCQTQPSLGAAFVALVVFSALVCVVATGFFATCAVKRDAGEASDNAETVSGLFGQAKILLSYLQIVASMPSVMDGVPWPDTFVSFTLPMGAINLDIMGLFQVSKCDLAISFQQQSILHMCLLPFLVVSILGAFHVSVCIKKPKTKEEKTQRHSACMKVLVLVILMAYPSLATRIFSLFRCIEVDGVEDGLVLAADFGVRCLKGDHVYYAIMGFVFMGIYVLGIPLAMFVLLFRNRKYLHDEKRYPLKHREVKAYLGGLYQQYEPRWWWFECFVILHKMLMTGALCVIGQGSSLKPLTGILFQLFFLLAVLKLAPFQADDDDTSSFASSLAITMTCLLGFAMMMDSSSEYDAVVLGEILVAIGTANIVFELFIMIRGEIRARREAKRANQSDGILAGKIVDPGSTKVMPSSAEKLRGNAENAWKFDQGRTD